MGTRTLNTAGHDRHEWGRKTRGFTGRKEPYTSEVLFFRQFDRFCFLITHSASMPDHLILRLAFPSVIASLPPRPVSAACGSNRM